MRLDFGGNWLRTFWLLYVVMKWRSALKLNDFISDINECENKENPVCFHTCIDKKIGYSCICDPGYMIHPNDSTLCIDIDECEMKKCPQSCRNTVGSYSCSCLDNYISQDNGHICKPNSSEFIF